MKKAIIIAMLCLTMMLGGCATMSGDVSLVTEIAIGEVFYRNQDVAAETHKILQEAIVLIETGVITSVEELEVYLVEQSKNVDLSPTSRRAMSRVVSSMMESMMAQINEAGLSGLDEITDKMIAILIYIDDLAVYNITEE